MGCSNSSFEMHKSKDNIQDENRDDDLLVLMKKRMQENKEIANHDLNKIKKLDDENMDEIINTERTKENNNNEKNTDEDNNMLIINGVENNNVIFSQLENDKENENNEKNNDNDINQLNGKNKENVNDNLEKDKYNTINNEIISQEEITHNNIEAVNLFSQNTSKNNISIIDKYFKTKKLNKSFMNKSKSNIKINKEPFTLKTMKGDSVNISTLKINAGYFLREYLIPIWFEKDTYVKFVTTGKWRIDKSCGFTDTKGMPTPNAIGFHYGACIARIGSSDPFVILPNEFTYITKNAGPLYIKMNLPRKMKVKPEGQIEMNIFDGEVLPIEEIYERIGWKENNMKYENNKGSEIENGLMTAINKLRMNPVLFYEKYFRDIQNILWIEKFLQEKEKTKNNIYRKPFIVNNNCYQVLDKYVNVNYVNKTNINRQKVSLYLNEMKQNLELYLNDNFKYKNFVNCKFTQKYKVNDICLQYLLDKKFRNIIFSNDYNYITVKVVENYINESNLIIICLSKIEENNEKEINEHNITENNKNENEKENDKNENNLAENSKNENENDINENNLTENNEDENENDVNENSITENNKNENDDAN